MGIFRLYLALAVLNAHYTFWNDFYFPYAFPAVCAFFIISGFYMSLVLHEKYADKIGIFYLNRAMRIYPICWIVLALTILGNYFKLLVDVRGINVVNNAFTPDLAIPLADRLMVMFNSATMFPGVIWNTLFGFPSTSPITMMLAGQMYTVGMELCFYAIAPFLLLHTGWRLFIVVASAAAYHFIPLILGAPDRPYQYEWFPAVLIFFMLGRVSYSLYVCAQRWNFQRWLGWLFIPAIALYSHALWTPLYQHISNTPETFGFYALVTVAVPFLCLASNEHPKMWIERTDRFIGDLSYPVYASHFLIIALVDGWSFDASTRRLLALGIVLVFSVALVVFVDHPIDRLRQRIARTRPSVVPSDSSGLLAGRW